MKNISKLYFFYPFSLLVVLSMSVALSGNLFVNTEYTFSIWFILFSISFFLGWIMHGGFQWKSGIKIISITTVIAVLLSLIAVALFRDVFEMNNSLVGNVVLYSLRVTLLGLGSLFGLSIAENMKNQKLIEESKVVKDVPEYDASQKAEFYIKEAKLKAEKIVFEAEKEAEKMKERKQQVELQLRELIHTEREVIRRYENEDTLDIIDVDSDSNQLKQ